MKTGQRGFAQTEHGHTLYFKVTKAEDNRIVLEIIAGDSLTLQIVDVPASIIDNQKEAIAWFHKINTKKLEHNNKVVNKPKGP